MFSFASVLQGETDLFNCQIKKFKNPKNQFIDHLGEVGSNNYESQFLRESFVNTLMPEKQNYEK